MSNYGNPNANKNGVQSSPASSGQSPYMGYQQNAYQTGPNQSAYQPGQNAGGYQVNQNSNPYQNPYQGYRQNPYQGAAQNPRQGYAGNAQNPYAQAGNQAPYQGQYGQGYVQNQTPGGQNVPNPGSGYAPYRTQQPYAAQPQGYAPRQTGPQPYAGMQSGPQPTYPGGQPGYTVPQGGMQQGYGYQGGMPQPGYGTMNAPYQGQTPQMPNQGRGNGVNNGPQGQMPGQVRGKAGRLAGLDLSRLLPIVGAVLLIGFFVGSLVTAAPVLKWIFLVLAAVSLAGIWLRPVLDPGPRLTASVLVGVAALVTVLSMVLTPGADRTTDGAGTERSASTPTPAVDDMAAAAMEEEGLGAWVAAEPVQMNVPTPTPDTTSATLENLSSFFYFWSVNNIDNMLKYCAPSWVNAQSDPRVALFQVLSNRIAKSYTLGTPTGKDNDITRTVAVTATVDKQNGDDYSMFVFNVIMMKENETWYVDPRSLQSHEEVEATTFSAVITQPPTPQPAEPSMVLYYNPDGGSYYHADPNCEAVAEKYRPLSGTFTFGQINEPAYADLKCCQRCAAPMRQNR